MGHQPFGVALNGVPFDPLTAEYWNHDRPAGWNIEALSGQVNLGLDQNNAHVQPDGTYHYHGIPFGLLDRFPYRDKPILLGYAADGFPLYGPWGYRDADTLASPMVKLTPATGSKQARAPVAPAAITQANIQPIGNMRRELVIWMIVMVARV